jgi:hypothetical protein
MVPSHVIKSCSHEKVADAAVLSLGGDFYRLVKHFATGQEVGVFVARLVRRFAESATEADWGALSASMAGKDMPILCGLRWLIETMVEKDQRRAASTARVELRRVASRDYLANCFA